MKPTAAKTIFNTQGIVSNFIVPASKTSGGLNQGALITEIFSAAATAIKNVVRYNGYDQATTTSSQVLFFKNVLPGDNIKQTTRVVRRMKDIKITIALQKVTGLSEEVVATGKFLYIVK